MVPGMFLGALSGVLIYGGQRLFLWGSMPLGTETRLRAAEVVGCLLLVVFSVGYFLLFRALFSWWAPLWT